MFEVEAVEQGFLGKRARLRALDGASDGARPVVAAHDGPWADILRAAFAKGDVVTVMLPAYVKLKVGQRLAFPSL